MPWRSQTSQRRGHWLAALAIMMLAACNTSTTSLGASHPTPLASATTTPAATSQPTNLPAVTPIPGNYSVYVDPTWGYSFEYPSDWIPYPSIGQADNGAQESSVSIMQPYTTDTTHPAVYLLVRATNNFQDYFVEDHLCNQPTTTHVDGFPAVDLFTAGGDPSTYYISPAYGSAFFAKGLAFEIWLQSSAREDYAIKAWLSYAEPIYQHVLRTFTVGPGTKTVAGC
jgi:hypothetical protein